MSSFDKINSIGQPKYVWSLKQLHLKEKYNIIKAERCDTDFGEKIMLELEDCKAYLPQRFTTELTCEDIENLPKCSMELLEPYCNSFVIDFHEKQQQEAKLTPVKKFQSVGQRQRQQKTIKKLKELQLKKKYNILNAKRNSSGIVVELDDCKVNLPKRFSTDLASQDIEDLTTCAMELLEPVGNSFAIDFHEKKEVKISFVDKFKALGQYTYQYPNHIKSLKELELKKWYKIQNAKKYISHYGEQIMVELEDCKVNLPKRFTSKLDDEDLTNLSKCSMQLLEPDGWSFLINFREEVTQ